MGGWEILIFAFGGIWYVVSAIAQAKEKAKKKKLREAALARERAGGLKESPISEPTAEVTRPTIEDIRTQRSSRGPLSRHMEKRRSDEQSARQAMGVDQGRGPAPPTQVDVTAMPSGGATTREARKLILDAMRREMGLPVVERPASTPSISDVTATPEPPPAAPASPTPRQPRPVPTRPPALAQRDTPAPTTQAATPAFPVPEPARRRQQATPRRGLGAVLRDPVSLKQAIVLAEVLGPPISLRSDHLSSS